jgi:electron transport complex protein RnfG
MTIRLALFGLITGLFVSVIYVSTKPLIIESKKEARLAQLYALAKPLLIEGRIEAPVEKRLSTGAPVTLTNPLMVTPIFHAQKQIGSVIPFQSLEGYSGTIQLLLALDTDQTIVGLRAVDHRETPGLGDQIDLRKSDWILDFNALSLNDLEAKDWAVKKDGGQFDSFTGATITPRAVIKALHDTLVYLDANPAILEVTQ